MWDIKIFEVLNFDGGAFGDEFWWVVTGKLIWVPLYALVLWLLYRKLGWRQMLVIGCAIGLGVGVVDLVAGFFKSGAFAMARFRPTHTEGLDVHLVHNYRGGLYGTVSAHAATSAVVTTISCFFMRRRWFAVMMCLWTAMVSYSRIYVAAHFPQDILLGLALGVITGFIFSYICRRSLFLTHGHNIR